MNELPFCCVNPGTFCITGSVHKLCECAWACDLETGKQCSFTFILKVRGGKNPKDPVENTCISEKTRLTEQQLVASSSCSSNSSSNYQYQKSNLIEDLSGTDHCAVQPPHQPASTYSGLVSTVVCKERNIHACRSNQGVISDHYHYSFVLLIRQLIWMHCYWKLDFCWCIT